MCEFLGLMILKRKEASSGQAAVEAMAPRAHWDGNRCRNQVTSLHESRGVVGGVNLWCRKDVRSKVSEEQDMKVEPSSPLNLISSDNFKKEK